MAAVNISDSRNTFFTSLPLEKNITRKSTQRKTRQGGTAKNRSFLPTAGNKQTANQGFHDASTKFVPDSQL